jgi:hypothetical protein
MMVWGGEPGPDSDGGQVLSDGLDGARFEPGSARWGEIPAAPIAARAGHLAVWSGSEMLVWGGKSVAGRSLLDGAAYDPVSDRWRRLSDSPLRGQGDTVGAWTGNSWLIIHGFGNVGRGSAQVATYEPAIDRWREIGELTVPPGSAAMAWTGSEALVLVNPTSGRSLGIRLSPAAFAWSMIEPPFDGIHAGLAILWTGSEAMMATAGERVPGSAAAWDQLVRYDPATDTWRRATLPPDALHTLEPLWSGRHAIFFGGAGTIAYDPAADVWHGVASGDIGYWEAESRVWASDRLIAWSGAGAGTGIRRRDGIMFIPGPVP